MSEASAASAWLELDAPLPPHGRMAAVEAGGLRLVLCHAAGAAYALEDRCPHAAARLSEGRLEGTVLECPLHGGKLDVRDGAPVAAPIRRPARRFAVRSVGGRVQVEVPHA